MLIAKGILALLTFAATPSPTPEQVMEVGQARPVESVICDADSPLASTLEYYSLALEDWEAGAGAAYAGDDGQTVGYATAQDDDPFEEGPLALPPTRLPDTGPPASPEPRPTLPPLSEPTLSPPLAQPILPPVEPPLTEPPFSGGLPLPAPVAGEADDESPTAAPPEPDASVDGFDRGAGDAEWDAEWDTGQETSCDAGAMPWTTAQKRWGLQLDGFISQGVTINTDSPADGSNFPVTFNDRSNDYLMNQFYLMLSRAVDDGACCWDVGGRVDLLYGSDAVYASARGLETRGDFSPKWNSGRYGLAVPQAYMEVYAPWGNGLTVKLGHFYTILGYETVPAIENFFYSKSYSFQYGEPATHTGLLGSTRLGTLNLQAGLTRGWDNWTDNNNDLAFLGGVNWASADERNSIAFAIHVGRERDEPPACTDLRTTYSLVVQHRFSERLQYVGQYNRGFEQGATARGGDANWFSLNQYLYYTLNCHWKAGVRYEWFRDEDGARIDPNAGADYYALSLGLNWTPTSWVTVRPELRWDSADALGNGRLDAGHRDDQILLGVDLTMRL